MKTALPQASVCAPLIGARTESLRPQDSSRLAEGLLKMLESERAQVAELIGGEIVSVMTMSRYLIEEALQRLARGELEETAESLQNACARLRGATRQALELATQLRPRTLVDLGLLPALASYFRDFSDEHRAIFIAQRISIGEDDIPPDLKLAAYRTVQVALSNVVRHSRASSARVFLSKFEGGLRLAIEDNGVGFDVGRWQHRGPSHEGCGLELILRWAESSAGRCSIESEPRHGTRVQVDWNVPPTRSGRSGARSHLAPRPPASEYPRHC